MKKIIEWIKRDKFYILFIIITFVICNVELPYYIMAPGGIINMEDRIVLDNKYETEGTLNLLYVSEYNAIIPTALMSFIFKDWDLNKIEEIQLNEETTKEIEIRNRIMLDNSRQNAIFVAYEKAGKEIKINGKENVVIATTVDNNLKIGDVILSVGGINIDNTKQLKEIINKKEVGDSLNVKVIRDDKEMEVSTKVSLNNEEKVIGIVMVTNYDYELEPPIKINFKNNEGGSSGGLMIALNIYNALTEEDITYSHKIAGTGTIDIMGNVGEIDGVKYKIIGAYKNGMELVFVPMGNYEEAIKVVEERKYDMEVVGVATFDEALEYLKTKYGDE